MKREDILEVVVRHIRLNLDGMDDKEIDPEASMRTLGATSLDIVEIVSCSMRDLRLKIPRTRLADAKNINGLVDLFLEVANDGAVV